MRLFFSSFVEDDRKGTVAHWCARFATARAVYDAINLRVSQLISSVTKSRSGHEFSRAPMSRNTVHPSAREFLVSVFWTLAMSLSSGGIFSGEGAREKRKRRSCTSSTNLAIAPTFKKERPKSLFAHVLRASSPYAYLHRRRNYRSSALYLSDALEWAECLPEIVT